MTFVEYKHNDFGTPYKLFKDLKTGDSIFEINY